MLHTPVRDFVYMLAPSEAHRLVAQMTLVNAELRGKASCREPNLSVFHIPSDCSHSLVCRATFRGRICFAPNSGAFACFCLILPWMWTGTLALIGIHWVAFFR